MAVVPSAAPDEASAAPPVADFPIVPLPWQSTDAAHRLRLSVADASLRAREEARQCHYGSPAFLNALGHARGYEDAVALLRQWSHPDRGGPAVAALVAALDQALRRAAAHASSTGEPYYTAYSSALASVLSLVRQTCAAEN